MHNKRDLLESSGNHPPAPQSMEKLSSMKPVPGAKMAGDTGDKFKEIQNVFLWLLKQSKSN